MINTKLLEIVEADKKARERVAAMSKSSDLAEEKLEKDREALEEKYKSAAEETIAKSARKHEAALESAAASYKKSLAATKAKIDELSGKSKSEWIRRICEDVTRP